MYQERAVPFLESPTKMVKNTEAQRSLLLLAREREERAASHRYER